MKSVRAAFAAGSARVDAAVDRLAVALLAIIFAAVLGQIVLRYVFDDPLVWSEELSRYAFIWVSLLGWTLATRRRSHIAVRLFIDMLPRRARIVLEIGNAVLVLGFAVVLGVLGARLAGRSADVPTITLFFSFAVVYAAVPVAATVIVLHAVRDILDLALSLRTEDEA